MIKKIRDTFEMAMFLFTFAYALTGIIRLASEALKELASWMLKWPILAIDKFDKK